VSRSARPLTLLVLAACAAVLAVGSATGGAPGPPTGAQLAALTQAPVAPPIASRRFYFVMTDRYANGSPANDRGGIGGGRGATGFDPTSSGWFHGGDFKGLTGSCENTKTGLARVKSLGFNAVWVTPPFGQKAVQGDSAAYHGYWITDFTHIDPHLGTAADFEAFVACAHRLGIKVYLDVVVNHTADVITLSGSGYSDAPYRDCRGKAFNPARYATGSTFPCLKAGNMPHAPVVLAADRNAKKPAWLNDPLHYHDRGDIDFSGCSELCFEQGDFFGLDDLFTEQPAVVNGLSQVLGDWVRTYKVDGFRIDTAKHVNAAFFRVWVPKILAAARAAGVPDFQLFGEVTLNSAPDLSAFVRDRGLPNVLDFPFQDAAAGFAAGTTNARALGRRVDEDDYFRLPGGVLPVPPTFLGNHDVGRAAYQIQTRARVSPAELQKRVLLGYDLLYLLRGAPVVYYGDEVGMIGAGGDKAAREDMFPTQVPEWRTEARVGGGPIGGGSSFDATANPVETELRTLAALRDANPALSTGASVVRIASGNVLVVSRLDLGGRREEVAAFNTGTAAQKVTFKTATASSGWTSLLGGTPVSSAADARLTVTLPPISATLLRANAQLPGGAPPKPVLKAGLDDVTSLNRVTASVAGGPVTVSFAVRRAKGAWRRLAIDDASPFRAFLDPLRYRKNERVYLVAVARGLDGATAVSSVVPLVLRRG
jgi:glycosidase